MVRVKFQVQVKYQGGLKWQIRIEIRVKSQGGGKPRAGEMHRKTGPILKSKFQTTLPFIFTGFKKTDYQIINEQKN